jgi:hypothetical protein
MGLCSLNRSSPYGPRRIPAISNPTTAGNRERRDSAVTATMTAIAKANFASSGNPNATDRNDVNKTLYLIAALSPPRWWEP